MRLFKFITPLLVLAILASCNSLFNNDNSSEPIFNLKASVSTEQVTTFNNDTLVFIPINNREKPLSEYNLPEFTSKLINNQIIIHGYYLASSDFKIASSFNYDGQSITIRIQMDEDDTVVPNIPKGYFYDAYITNIPKGDYNINIIHDNDLLRGKYGEEHTVFTKKFVIE